MDRRVLFGALAGALVLGKDAAAAPFATQRDVAVAASGDVTEARVRILARRGRVAERRAVRRSILSGRRLGF